MTGIWLRGLIRRRGAQLVAAALSVAAAVGFLAALGTFVGVNGAHLTDRAAASVGVDWQVQVVGGADPAAVQAAVRKVPELRSAAPVTYLPVAGFNSVV
ncbi:MAG: putative transport system permease protein, partial [Frankiaceae bacterium]|nr:putative transport system permease protein [Frankiaceae bacterium]